MKVKSCEFIETVNSDGLGNEVKSIFVPRPKGWLVGWARHQWLKGYFKQECKIAAPEFWSILIERYGRPKMLIEEDNVFRIEECD